MEVFEITDLQTGVSQAGVNYLQPTDSFQKIENGFIYRQVLQSRQGIGLFTPRLANGTRVLGIFEHTLPDSTTETLAFDTMQMYKYMSGTFVPIPFGGSLAAYGGFAITEPEDYITGTSYPTATNTARFVFTGKGIKLNGTSAVFFYDGTNVKDFTNVVDNPDYQAPLQGPLNRAKYVIWFGERLNFFYPTINSIAYAQGILYSGIRTVSGNGDKFAIAGSGLLQADTYQFITGASILGQVIAINFDRSNWTLEKTTDAFNPYFIRKVPSVLGCNADYSAVSWNDLNQSIGKTGIISTDGRQSLKSDNKIPKFTADQIDQISFDYTYGGFDRINNQFLWSYVDSGSGALTQDKVLVYNYEFDTWNTFDMRLTVFGQTDNGINLTWNQIEGSSENDPWNTWNSTTDIWNKIGLGLAVQKTLAGDNLGFIYEFNKDNDDYYTAISNITNATQAGLTVTESAFQAGDLVAIQLVEGMTEINNYISSETNIDFMPYTVVSATTTSITLSEDSSNFSAYTTGGYISKIIPFVAETIPFNPYRSLGRRIYVSHIEVLINTSGGVLKMDVYQDEEESPFLQDIPLLTTTIVNQRQWVTITINNEANFFTFVLKNDSPEKLVKITSIRIHAQMGGFTSG